MLGPGGHPLTQTQFGSASDVPSVPLPQPLGDIDLETIPDPPEGVPRAALHLILMLRAMGVRKYEPGVMIMLLEVMHGYTSEVLKDALFYRRMRQLRKRGIGEAFDVQDTELADAEFAVRGRTSHSWTRPPAREVLAQQASEVNTMPMPLLPKRPCVTLPEAAACDPGARQLVARGIESYTLSDGWEGEEDDR